jgi:hypothetical protein
MKIIYEYIMKRTTLVLEEAVMDAVRELARKQKRQLSRVVNELLLEGVRKRRKPRPGGFELPSFSMGKPRVNLADRNALEALMDS